MVLILQLPVSCDPFKIKLLFALYFCQLTLIGFCFSDVSHNILVMSPEMLIGHYGTRQR